MDDGRYCHLGLTKGLISVHKKLENMNTKQLQLLFNVDGLPITRGGEKNFWPILCQVTNVDCGVFSVGIYEGKTKPKCFNSFMSEFVAELKELVENGVMIHDVHFQVKGL